MQVIRRSFPHKRRSGVCQAIYLRYVLELAVALPRLRDDVVCIMLEHLTKLDVDVKEDPEEEDADEDGADHGTMETQFEVELGDSGDEEAYGEGDEDVASEVSEDWEDEHNGSDSELGAEADEDSPKAKLDALMCLAMDYVGYHVNQSPEELEALFAVLMREFERIVLPTYQTKHVQFLLFYACSYHAPLCREFIASLVAKALEPSIALILRQSAVAYVASFLARARFVEPLLVSECLDSLVGWLHEYLHTHEHSRDEGATGHHTHTRAHHKTHNHHQEHHLMFHAIAQAVMYIICFRAKTFCETDVSGCGCARRQKECACT
jgi:RNA polymerase I-specific transcription initiation factor RRN3